MASYESIPGPTELLVQDSVQMHCFRLFEKAHNRHGAVFYPQEPEWQGMVVNRPTIQVRNRKLNRRTEITHLGESQWFIVVCDLTPATALPLGTFLEGEAAKHFASAEVEAVALNLGPTTASLHFEIGGEAFSSGETGRMLPAVEAILADSKVMIAPPQERREPK